MKRDLILHPDFGALLKPGRPYNLRATATNFIVSELPNPDRGCSITIVLSMFSVEPAIEIPPMAPMLTIECLTEIPSGKILKAVSERLSSNGIIVVACPDRGYQTSETGEWVTPCLVDPMMLGIGFSERDLEAISRAQEKRDRKAKRGAA